MKLNNLLIFRRLSGLSQWELARRVGRTQPWISQIEAGHITPTYKDAKKLARVLKIDVSLLSNSKGTSR